MVGGDELSENSDPLLGLALMVQHGETRIYVLEAELKMGASKTERIRILLSNESRRENQRKTRWEWSCRHKNECEKCD